MSTQACCGRPSAEACRCHTDAAAIADAIRAFVARRVSRPHDAEDITQETLLRIYRSAETLADEQALEAWMYRIARNAVTDHYRRSTLRPEPVAPEDVAALAHPRSRRSSAPTRRSPRASPPCSRACRRTIAPR